AVAVSGNFVTAAQGSQGVALIDVSDPANARDVRDITVGGPVRAVASADGLAYAGSASGLIAVVDLPSGFVLDRVQSGSSVHDLAISGEVLFVALDSDLRSYQLVGGHLKQLSDARLAFGAEGLTGRRRISVGTTFAQISNAFGFEVFDI